MTRYTRQDLDRLVALINHYHDALRLEPIALSIWSPGDRLGTRYQVTDADGSRTFGHVACGISAAYSMLYTHYCLVAFANR